MAGWPRPEPNNCRRSVEPARACGKSLLETQLGQALSAFPCACLLSRRTHTRGEPKESPETVNGGGTLNPRTPLAQWRQPNSKCKHMTEGSGGVWQGGQGLNPTTVGRSVEPARACGKPLLENPTTGQALSTFPCACLVSRRTHTRGEPKESQRQSVVEELSTLRPHAHNGGNPTASARTAHD